MHFVPAVRSFTGLALIAAVSIAWQQAPPAAVGTLSIQTTPAEATVIVDGEVRGTSPMLLPIAAGSHRVVIKRAGYLENSADVEVTAGRTFTLERTLTPESRTGTGRGAQSGSSGSAPPPRQSPPPRETAPRESPPPREAAPPRESPPAKGSGGPVTRVGSGGGSAKKWALIGVAGAAGAGAAAYSLSQKNAAVPVPGTISITPSGNGMAGQTVYTLRSVNASDGDRDPLTFAWTFGDGTSGSGQSVTHTFGRTGSFAVSLTVSDGKHTVNPSNATVTVGPSLAGTWTGGSLLMPNTAGSINVLCPVTLTITQNGAALNGVLAWVTNCNGSITLAAGNSNGGLTHPAPVVFGNTGGFTFNGIPNLFLAISGTTNAAGTSLPVTFTLSRPATGGVSTTSTTFTKSG